MQLRDSENSTAGAAVSKRNLTLVLASIARDAIDVGSLPLGSGGSAPIPIASNRRSGVAAFAVVGLVLMLLAGAGAAWVTTTNEQRQSWIADGRTFLQRSLAKTASGDAVAPRSQNTATELREDPIVPSDSPAPPAPTRCLRVPGRRCRRSRHERAPP